MAKRQLENNASDLRGYYPTTAKQTTHTNPTARIVIIRQKKRTRQLDLNLNPVPKPKPKTKQKRTQKKKPKPTRKHNTTNTSAETQTNAKPSLDQAIQEMVGVINISDIGCPIAQMFQSCCNNLDFGVDFGFLCGIRVVTDEGVRPGK
eukprot:scaffold156167_cov41-Attheya_sp.AAC.1